MRLKIKEMFRSSLLPVLFVSVGIGLVAAFIVYFYNLAAEFLLEHALHIFEYAKGRPAFLPLLILGAGIIAFVITLIIKYLPDVSGGGIPYIEGVVRGKFSMRWLLLLPAMFFSSLLSIFLGLSLGSEGPSVFIGGAAGYGASSLLKGRQRDKRLFATAGAASGLAVAFNAPLSGLVFSVEEAHRRFSPQIIIPSAVAIVTATLAVRFVFGSKAYLDFSGFDVSLTLPHILGAVTVGLVAGVLGIFFSAAVTKDFKKIRLPKIFRVLIPAAVAVILGLLVPYAIGGGKRILAGTETLAQAGAISVLLILLAKFLLTVLSARSGASGGLFIPMLALGALTGILLSQLLTALGAQNSLIFMAMLGAAAFFAAAAQSPITAAVLLIEITRFDAEGLALIVICVVVAYVLAQTVKAKPLYEEILERIKERKGIKEQGATHESSFRVFEDSYACNRALRDLVLPDNTIVINVSRGGEDFAPDGETVFLPGDVLIIAFNPERAAESEFARLFTSA